VAEKADTSATPAPRPDDGAAAQAEAFRTAAEGIRRRADVAAKTLGGLATTAVSAIGIAKFSDIYPLPPGEKPWAYALVAGFAAMLIAVGFFTYRLWRVNEPIVLRSSVSAMGKDLRDEHERDIVWKIYDEVARLNRMPSLRAYEARAHRLLRIADRVDEPRVAKVGAKASVIIEDIVSTETRALMVITRRRSSRCR
jgi:hypothetical protein